MSGIKETRAFGRRIVIALVIICVILMACLGGVIATYTLILGDKDNTISSLNTQISKLDSNVTSLQNQIASDRSTIDSLNSDLTNLQGELKIVLGNSSSLEDIIMSNPSAWANSTVSVEGVIDPVLRPLEPYDVPPWDYALSFDGHTIGVSWQGSFYNGENVTVQGVVTGGHCTWLLISWANGTGVGRTEYGPLVYFIEAKSIEPL